MTFWNGNGRVFFFRENTLKQEVLMYDRADNAGFKIHIVRSVDITIFSPTNDAFDCVPVRIVNISKLGRDRNRCNGIVPDM